MSFEVHWEDPSGNGKYVWEIGVWDSEKILLTCVWPFGKCWGLKYARHCTRIWECKGEWDVHAVFVEYLQVQCLGYCPVGASFPTGQVRNQIQDRMTGTERGNGSWFQSIWQGHWPRLAASVRALAEGHEAYSEPWKRGQNEETRGSGSCSSESPGRMRKGSDISEKEYSKSRASTVGWTSGKAVDCLPGRFLWWWSDSDEAIVALRPFWKEERTFIAGRDFREFSAVSSHLQLRLPAGSRRLTCWYLVSTSMSPRVPAKVLSTASGTRSVSTLSLRIPTSSDLVLWKGNVLEIPRRCHWVVLASMWAVCLGADPSLELVFQLYGSKRGLFLNGWTPSNSNKAFSLGCLYLYPLHFPPTCVFVLCFHHANSNITTVVVVIVVVNIYCTFIMYQVP